MMQRFVVKSTEHEQIIDVTDKVKEAIKRSNVQCGICVVYVPNSTAAITINHKDDEDLNQDFLTKMDDLIPWTDRYLHVAGDTAAHLKASLLGSSVTVIVEDGKPVLGSYQSILFADFNGPHSHKLYVKVQADCDAAPAAEPEE